MPTIEYLISVQHQLYWKTPFHMACKEGQFDVVELMQNNKFKAFRINLNAHYVIGTTHYNVAIYSGKLVRLLDAV